MNNSYVNSRQTTPQAQADKVHLHRDDDEDEDEASDDDVKHKDSKRNPKKRKSCLKDVASSVSCDRGGANIRLTVDGEHHGGDNNREATPLKESSSFAHQQHCMENEASRYRYKQRRGFIDVWWLFDDGGMMSGTSPQHTSVQINSPRPICKRNVLRISLTLLVPYILTTKKMWSNCKLRVFIAASKKAALDRDQRQMASMLNKFRIEYSSMTVVQDIETRPKPESTSTFNELVADWLKPDDEDDDKVSELKDSWKFSKQELLAHKAKTLRHIRLRELLQQHSHDASLIVMTLPMPRKGFCPAGLYMAWIDTLTRDMPPVLLLRGNQENVLTYYS